MNRNYAGIGIVIIIVLCFTGLLFFWVSGKNQTSGSLGGKYGSSSGSNRSPAPVSVRETAVPDNAAEPDKRGIAEPSVIGPDAEKTSEPDPQAEIRYSIEGRVADSSTKAPVHNAAVQMASTTCMTDERGVFKFNLDVKINVFQVMRIAKERSYKSMLQEIQLQKGVPEQDLGVFYLAGDGFTGTVEGSVYDINGLLLDNADIALFEINSNLGSVYTFDILDLSVVKTKSRNGRYCFDGLPAGRYKLRAGSREFKRVETGYFDLAEGEKKIVDINLTSEKIRYAGRVTDQEMNPAGDVVLIFHTMPDADDNSCSDANTKTFKVIHTDASGRFEVFLNKEVDKALVYKKAFAPVLAGISAGDGNNIVLSKSRVIKGYVLRKDTEKPVQGVKVWLETDNESAAWYGAYGFNIKDFINEGGFTATGAPGEIYDGDQNINLYSLINNPVGTDQNGYFEFSGVPAGFSSLRCRVANDSIQVMYRTEFFADDGADEKNIVCRIPAFVENVEFTVIDAETGKGTGPNTYIKANKTDDQAVVQYFYWFMKNSISPGLYAIEVTAEGYETLKTQLDVTLETSGRKITYKLQKDKNHPEILISGKVYENNLIARSYNFVINPQPDERIGMGWGGYERNILTDGDGNYQFLLDSSMLEELRNESRKSGQVKLTLHCYSNTAETAVEIFLNEQDFLDAQNRKIADIYLSAK